ncbi:hypothetical protein [Streptomyces sp. NPDC059597]|uniref:hypothetical protein n=1 Tax=Streptomyces sp. NPDC059597 TaxID=3346879 RepID=UPI00368BFB9F
MGSWIFALAFAVVGATCLRFQKGKRLRSAASALIVVAVPSYLFGAFAVLFADPARMCEQPGDPLPEPLLDRFDQGFFPLRADCRWPDGHVDSLLPVWVNPLICACLGAAAVCVVAAVVLRHGTRTAHRR